MSRITSAHPERPAASQSSLPLFLIPFMLFQKRQRDKDRLGVQKPK